VIFQVKYKFTWIVKYRVLKLLIRLYVQFSSSKSFFLQGSGIIAFITSKIIEFICIKKYWLQIYYSQVYGTIIFKSLLGVLKSDTIAYVPGKCESMNNRNDCLQSVIGVKCVWNSKKDSVSANFDIKKSISENHP